ncbi:prolyl 4-hydroxylase subunit alpha-1-like isoform X2 [Teleopsis dalmanni]|uniref:prolyl 4-hydroxylase subunit alpha-1-like isoform X2 n=1 Tax=Teleopsis dalmanni TaxID=139649 RepID=UPI0018CF269F|nr:prolyl 4-hydroxylase subunit alpha-1-like isoform X2 [Teleopsis dalmanni]
MPTHQSPSFLSPVSFTVLKMRCWLEGISLMNSWMCGKKVIILCSLIIAAAYVPCGDAEYFSSVDSLNRLGEIEMELIEGFRHYLELQAEEFAGYRKFIEKVKAQHAEAERNLEDYLGNPINAFTLIKRMVIDWTDIHELIKENELKAALREDIEELGKQVDIPNESDLIGTVRGFARLQKVYKLSTEELAYGIINGVDYEVEITWRDCFEIATTLYDQNELILAVTWFEMVLEKIQDETEESVQYKFEIDTLEYLVLATYDLGDTDKAVGYIDEILNVDPKNIMKNFKNYMLYTMPKRFIQLDNLQSMAWYANYTRLCSGDRLPDKLDHTLKCKIGTRNNPYFILAPLKIEELNLEPEITLYHDLLNNNQIDDVLEQAKNNMARSEVVNGTMSVVRDVRVSQQTWLDYSSPVMRTIYNLVSHISALDLKNAEIMQVANYGIAGQYEPHYDFFGFSDVEQGGFTVFPKLNLFLPPIKGALVMWYNLHKSVDLDMRMLHAGCPVIKGSKRIGNIWVHSDLQEFTRPCELTNDKYKSVELN